MKRYNTMSTTLPHLEKEADRVQILLERIRKAEEEIKEIQCGINWMNYTDDSFNNADDETAAEFYRMKEFIQYANDR